MRNMFSKVSFYLVIFFFTSVAVSQQGFAQAGPPNGYIPHEIFDPNFDNNGGNVYRSANGAPGPQYWQNTPDYKITASLDTTTKAITGKVEISYTNNSPDELSYVWLQLEQNQLSHGSRGLLAGGNPSIDFVGGDSIKSIRIDQNGRSFSADYVINDTRLQIRLPVAMKPHGDKINITVEYSFVIPPNGMGRTSWMYTKNGTVYDVAQWYPRMEVYDDVNGWNNLPFLGEGEFYCDYGNFDYSVTVPADMIVVGSGELVNQKEVLTKKEIERLAEARKSDKRVYIVNPDEVGNPKMRPAESGVLTWHFKMSNSRDAVWACSRAFIWDAARINLPSGKNRLRCRSTPSKVRPILRGDVPRNMSKRASKYFQGTGLNIHILRQ